MNILLFRKTFFPRHEPICCSVEELQSQDINPDLARKSKSNTQEGWLVYPSVSVQDLGTEEINPDLAMKRKPETQKPTLKRSLVRELEAEQGIHPDLEKKSKLLFNSARLAMP